MLIIFGGLPGAGKSTIARQLAEQIEALYLRIGTIEHAMRCSNIVKAGEDIGPAGYLVACEIAADNLRIGRTVVADSVNPIAVTREAYRAVAAHVRADYFEVEVVCSDKAQHRTRIETRKPDIAGLELPSWRSVVARDYESWDGPQVVIDTSLLSAEESVRTIISVLSSCKA